LKIPKFMVQGLLDEVGQYATKDIPADWTATSKEARCALQLADWFLKRVPELENVRPLARGIAYKCDTDDVKRKDMARGLKDLYLLLDSYDVVSFHE